MWVLYGGRVHWIDPYESLNGIIPKCQLDWFTSSLCMWSFDLRLQRYLVDGWSCFDYDLWIHSHGISKMSYIGYNMKSTKMIVWSRWDHPPSVFEEVDSKEWEATKSLAKVVKILEEFSMISTHISTNLSNRLGFHTWPYLIIHEFSVGAVLRQHIEKKLTTICYASKTLIDAQLYYTTTDKELLAVVFALEKFRP